MKPHETTIFLDKFKFPEGVRWHDNKLWFSDIWANKVYCYDLNGDLVKEINLNDSPVGLDWLSDDSLIITSLENRKLLKLNGEELSEYINLDLVAPGYCHDLVVANNNTIYLSVSGFMPAYNVKPVESNILMVTADREIKVVAKEIGYPNGIIITPDGKYLIVAETFAARLSYFEINCDNTLTNKKIWAEFDKLGFQVSFDSDGVPNDKKRHYPDGICYDKNLNAVWVASPGKNEILCVECGGNILRRVKTLSPPFDCVLGGDDGQTLYIATSDMNQYHETGKIEVYILPADRIPAFSGPSSVHL